MLVKPSVFWCWTLPGFRLLWATFWSSHPIYEVCLCDLHMTAAKRAKINADCILGSLAFLALFFSVDGSAVAARDASKCPIEQGSPLWYILLAVISVSWRSFSGYISCFSRKSRSKVQGLKGLPVSVSLVSPRGLLERAASELHAALSSSGLCAEQIPWARWSWLGVFCFCRNGSPKVIRFRELLSYTQKSEKIEGVLPCPSYLRA